MNYISPSRVENYFKQRVGNDWQKEKEEYLSNFPFQMKMAVSLIIDKIVETKPNIKLILGKEVPFTSVWPSARMYGIYILDGKICYKDK